MRAVLIPIADAANRDGDHAHPGKEAIMDGSLYGRSAVTKAIQRLIVERWIEVEEWGQGRGQATVYRVLMDRPPSTPEPVTTPPKAPKCGSPERANSWPLSGEQAATPASAAYAQEKGHNQSRKGPPVTTKAATAPTWNALPTENLPTETLPTRGANGSGIDGEAQLDLRAGLEVQEPHTADRGDELLVAVADAAPPTCRWELLDDPDQAAGRSALRRRLELLAAEVGPESAVAIVAGDWPSRVDSAMAHANGRARTHLRSRRPPDPLDGIAAATAALAERAVARQLELAHEPLGLPPPSWKDHLLARLHGARSDG